METQSVLDKFRNYYTSNSDFNKAINLCIKVACDNSEFDLVFSIAQMCSNNDVVKIIIDNCYPKPKYNSKLLMLTIEKYNIKFIDDGYEYLMRILRAACNNNDVQTLNWLVANTDIGKHIKEEICSSDIMIPFKVACINKNYAIVKWMLENTCDPHFGTKKFKYIYKIIADGDFTLVDIFKSYNINIKTALNIALVEATKYRSTNRDIILKLIEYGADIESVNISTYMSFGMIDIVKKLVNDQNYLKCFKIVCLSSSESKFEFMNWIYCKYGSGKNTSTMFSFLAKDKYRSTFMYKCDHKLMILIFQDDYKLFVDVFASEKDSYMSYPFNNLNLSKIQKNVIEHHTMRSSKRCQLDYSLFDPYSIDEMALYILYKHNDIVAFNVLKNIYPYLEFEVDINGRLVNYSFGNSQIKSARKI